MGEKKGLDIEMLRHGMSHVLAKALKRIYGDIKLTIGPAIDNGFYYDVDLNRNISPEDFNKIEEPEEKPKKEKQLTMSDFFEEFKL